MFFARSYSFATPIKEAPAQPYRVTENGYLWMEIGCVWGFGFSVHIPLPVLAYFNYKNLVQLVKHFFKEGCLPGRDKVEG